MGAPTSKLTFRCARYMGIPQAPHHIPLTLGRTIVKTLTKTAIAAVSVAALCGVSTAAYAATAANLALADVMYQSSYSDEPAALWTTASNGAATVVGVPATIDLFDNVDGAWNPTDGSSYVIGNGYEGPCELWSANTTTGQFELVAVITGDAGDTFDCDAFDIAVDGTAWVTMYDTESPTLAKLNLTDGTTSDAVSLTGDFERVSWLAIQPSTGTFFLGDFSGNVSTVDPTTGVTTAYAATPDNENSFYDAAFDSNGRLWITGWPDNTELYSTDIADYTASFVSQGAILIDGSGDLTGTDSLWIARGGADPAPALAATGIDAGSTLIAGLLVLLVGAGAIVVTRRRTV